MKKKNEIIDIKIVEIRKNEHFGDALMFLNERSPINAKIKTKNAELLMLRKIEAIEIYLYILIFGKELIKYLSIIWNKFI